MLYDHDMKFLAPLALLVSSLSVSPAFAHAFLVKASPSAGSTVTTPPSVLLMTFTEALEVPFCSVTVANAAGAAQQTAKPQPVPGHPDELSVPLQITAPGKYSVTWHALSVDTHKTQGHFTFTVAG
jgi:methionine-rich copper-binding protein CopC